MAELGDLTFRIRLMIEINHVKWIRYLALIAAVEMKINHCQN